MRSAAVALLVAVGLVLAGATGAGAQGAAVDRAARALQSAPVYQDPAAENALGAQDLTELRRQVAASASVCSTRVCESHTRISTVPKSGCGRTSYQSHV